MLCRERGEEGGRDGKVEADGGERGRRGRMMSEGRGKQAGSGGVAGVTEEKDEVGRAGGATVIWVSGCMTGHTHAQTHRRPYSCSVASTIQPMYASPQSVTGRRWLFWKVS